MTHLRRSRLSALALKTALGTSLVVLAPPGFAQVARDEVPLAPSSNRPQTRFDTVTNAAGGQTLTVDLRNRPSTIINWRSFDIGADSVARFVSTNGEVANLTDAFSVLNRVTSGNPTTILGQLTSQPNIAVFLLNGSGIVFGTGSAVSTGSFVASTLGIADRDFTRGKFRFQQGEGLSGPITTAAGAALRSTGAEGMRRGVVLVAPTIESAGRIEGGGGDVAFVSAADVTLSLTPGSPLGISITRGLPVQASQVVGGRIEGQSVYLALATEAEVTASLLRIDGNVRAVGTANGVVIVGGETPGDAPGVTFRRGSNAQSTSGVVDIVAGETSALRSAGDITLVGRGDADLRGLISAGGDLSVRLLGDADLAGRTLADGDTSVVAASVGLAGLRTGGTLLARARDGTLAIGSAVAGDGADLRAAGDLTISSQVRTGAATRLSAGEDIRIAKVVTRDGGLFVSARNGEVTGADPDRGAILTVGRREDGTADSLGIRAASLVRLGRASASGDLAIGSAGGDIEARRLAGAAMSLSVAEGSISLDRAVAQDGMRLAAGQDIIADGALRAGGGLTILSGGETTAGVAIAETGTVRVRADAITLGLVQAGGAIQLNAVEGDISLGRGSAGEGARLGAAGDIAIARGLSAAGQVTLRAGEAVRAARLRSFGDDVRVAADAITLERAQAAAVLRLQALAGDLSIGRGIAGNTAFLQASGAVTASNLLRAGSRLGVQAGTDAILSGVRAGGGVFLDAAEGDLSFRFGSAGRRAVLSAGDEIRGTGTFTAAEDLTILGEGGVTLRNAVADTGDLRIAGETIDLAGARAGGRLALGATAGDITLRFGEAGASIRMIATGDVQVTRDLDAGQGLRLDAGGAVSAGTASAGGAVSARGSSVAFRSVDAGSDLTLTARAGAIDLGEGVATGAADLTAAGDVRVRRTLETGRHIAIDASGMVRLGTLTARNGGVDVSATQAVRASGAISAGRGVSVTASGAAVLADVRARRGDLEVRGDRVNATQVSAVRGALVVEATGGDVSLGSVRSGADARITATGAVRATGPLFADGDLGIAAERAVTIAAASARTGDLDITGTRISATRLTAGEALSVDATRGDVQIGRASAGGDLSLDARGALNVAGPIAAGGALTARAGGAAVFGGMRAGTDLRVRADAITLASARAGDALDLRARTGDLFARDTIAGDALKIVANGSVTVQRTASGARVAIDADGAAILGVVAGTSGPVTIAGDDLVARRIEAAGGLTLDAREGSVRAATISADGASTITAAGDVRVRDELSSGRRMAVTAGGVARLASAEAGRSLSVTAARMAVGSAAAGGNLLLRTTAGALDLESGGAGGEAAIDAATELTVTDALQASGTIALRAGADVALGAITAGGDLAVDARAGAVRGVDGEGATLIAQGGGDIRLTAAGVADLAVLDAGGRARVQASSVGADVVRTGGRLSISAADGALAIGSATAGGRALLDAAGDLIVRDTLASGGSADLSAGGAMRLGTVVAQDGGIAIRAAEDVSGVPAGRGASLFALGGEDEGGRTVSVIAGGSIRLAAVEATGGVDARADGELTAARVRATDGDIRMAADEIAAGSLVASDRLLLTADTGSLSVRTGRAGGAASLAASGDVTVGQRLAGSGVTIRTDGDAALARVTARDGALVIRAREGSVAGVTPGSGAVLEASGADGRVSVRAGGLLRLDRVRAGDDVRLRTDPAGSVALGGIRVRGDLRVDSGAISGGSLVAGGRVDAIARAGAIDLGRVVARSGPVNLRAEDGIALNLVRSSGRLGITADDEVTVAGLARAGGDLRIVAAGVAVGTAVAGGRLTLSASDGAVSLGRGEAGDAALLDASGEINVIRRLVGGGAVTLRAGGDATLGAVQATGGDLLLDARQGTVTARALTGDSVGVYAGAGAGLTQVSATQGSVTVVTGASAASPEAVSTGGTADLGTVVAADAVTVRAGSITAGTMEAGGSLAMTAGDGTLSLGRGRAGGAALLDAAGSINVTRRLVAGGAVTLRAGGDANLAAVRANGGDLLVDARQGLVTGRALSGQGAQLYAGNGATLGKITATQGDVTLVTGATNAAPDATSTGGTATLGTVVASGAAIVRAGSIAAGRVEAGDALTLSAVGGTLSVDQGVSGADALLEASGAIDLTGRLTAAGAATLRGTAIIADEVEANAGSLLLAATGGGATDGVRLRRGFASGDATIASAGDITVTGSLDGDAVQLTTGADRIATLGTISASTGLTIEAGDVELTGVATAPVATIRSNGAAGMTLGDGPDGGLQLSNAEVARIDVPDLIFDAGAGSVRLGALSLGSATGERSTTVATTGAIEVTGAVTAGADGRTVVIGGVAGDEGSRASSITIVATLNSGLASSGGGRLLFDGDTLHLRGDRIAAGQREGFLDVLGGLTDARTVADQFVNNARSALYAARQPYPDAPVLVSARSMSVRYGTYALFQNTGRLTTAAGVNGSRTGVVLGTPGEGPSLTLRSDGAGAGNTFAMFGTIAGATNDSAAVVGETILSTRIDGTDTIVIQDSRVNGCIIGTGAGCLTTPIGIPPVNIFDPSRLNVFVPADFEIAFDPVIGSNNEALFAGIAAIDVPTESELPFDPAIGSNNEALFTGAADDAAAGEDGCPEDQTGRTCPRKESRK